MNSQAWGKAIVSRRTRLAECVQLSMQHVCSYLYETDVKATATPSSFYKEMFKGSYLFSTKVEAPVSKKNTVEILAAIDHRVLLALCKGNLLEQDHLLKTLPMSTEEDNPVIYAFFHVDENNQPPTKTDYQIISRWMDNYVNNKTAVGNQYVKWIDGKVEGTTKNEKRYLPSQQSKRVLREWLQAFSARLDTIDDTEADLPLPWPVAEVGYTKCAFNRILQHQEHRDGSMNTLMALLDAASKCNFDDRYTMRPVLLYECYRESHAPFAEHILSHLCGAYVNDGGLNGKLGGFSST